MREAERLNTAFCAGIRAGIRAAYRGEEHAPKSDPKTILLPDTSGPRDRDKAQRCRDEFDRGAMVSFIELRTLVLNS